MPEKGLGVDENFTETETRSPERDAADENNSSRFRLVCMHEEVRGSSAKKEHKAAKLLHEVIDDECFFSDVGS